MPIRFACPHCHQRLSVSTRKAGLVADCPRCRASLTIPQPPPEEPEPPSESFLVAEKIGSDLTEPLSPPSSPETMSAPFHSLPPIEMPPGDRAKFRIAPHDSGELQMVADPSAAIAPPTAIAKSLAPRPDDAITVPRYAIYLHGGLLLAVALSSLVIGILLGASFVRPPAVATAPHQCIVSGTVTHTIGKRTRPDRGAVIVLLPVLAEAAGERAAVAGLRPSDPPPAADNAGLGAIRQLGGSYMRADANGRFETRLPAPGRYWLLVVSHEQATRAAADSKDLRLLSRYLQNAAELLEDRSYQLTQETIRGDRQVDVSFSNRRGGT
jgi:hypothetical protein